MKIELSNKVALVSDASSEIGQAICRQLAESGARVIGLCPTEETLEKTLATFKSQQSDVEFLEADVRIYENCQQLVAKIETDCDGIDIIINNTDTNTLCDFADMSKEQWSELIGTNLDPAFNLCRQISEGMSERGFGRIINISSVNARRGVEQQSAYAASKAGVHGFTMALAQELARKGVTVNTVSPGQIKTDAFNDMSADTLNDMLMDIPASRFGKADDVASLVDFLCSQQAGYITGSDIPVNGGQYIH